MFYNYTCPSNCKIKQLSKMLQEKLAIEKHPKGLLVWTEQHGMNDTPCIKCPVCGNVAIRTWHGVSLKGYTKGNCYLNRDDCKRHMDLRLLESGNDPYKHMRQPGETDDLTQRLKKKKTPRR